MPGAEEHDGPAASRRPFRSTLPAVAANADDPRGDAPVRIAHPNLRSRDFARAPCLRRGERANERRRPRRRGRKSRSARSHARRSTGRDRGRAPVERSGRARGRGRARRGPRRGTATRARPRRWCREMPHPGARIMRAPASARRRALDLVHADEGGRAMRRDDLGKARKSLHAKGLPRTASQARRIASGVAGASSGTGFCGSSARTASASAQNTLCASINGGSPTAFER